ncbi:right-handed parallel beta-helix repeat-containing protein, partial [Planctomycetota bacterium]
MTSAVAAGDVIYVKVSGAGDGTSWASAYGDLQDGLDDANPGDEIWVAEGTYYPTCDYSLGIGDRGKHFRMINGVGIYGGFEAAGNPSWGDRNLALYKTILSGDIGIVDDDSDNCFHIFYHPDGTDLDPNAILDGFNITKAKADSDLFGDSGVGAGMYNWESNPTLLNCIFSENSAGAITVTGAGGGMYNYYSSPTLLNCIFNDNGASSSGGGMYNLHCSSTLTNCIFDGNVAYDGGGILNYSSNPTVTNCIFIWNSALGDGGGICNFFNSSPVVTNCTFSNNIEGGGMFNSENSSPTLTNCILWPDQMYGDGAPLVSYSDVSGGWPGTGNINADPQFVSISNLHLQAGSPCLDHGDNDSVPDVITTDLDGLPRIVNLVVDMGAYESQELTVICVDTNAAGANNGITWLDAFNYLQDGLAAADYGDKILVAQGTYKPDQDTAGNVTPGSRNETFNLIDGVALYGGFLTGGSDFTDRDPEMYLTTLSGDLLENDGPDFANNNENSYHVVISTECDPNTILDGFTIYGGNADGSDPDNYGAGMYNDGGSPTVIRCSFIGNSAGVFGGGLFNNGGSPTVLNCSFFGNSTDSVGGAIFNKYSELMVVNSVFSGNTAHNLEGGAIYNDHLSPIFINCSFTANAAHDGGAMYNNYSSPTITNCLMWLNSAPNGPEIFNEGGSSIPLISYCDIKDSNGSGPSWNTDLGTDGGGNIDIDPQFKNPDGPDDIAGTADDDLQLAYDSPCIDAGDNTALPPDTYDLDSDSNTTEPIPHDRAHHARFTDDPLTDDSGNGTPPIVEMGAFERFELCGDADHPYPPGDANQDCVV